MKFVTNFKIKELFSESPPSSFIIEILGKTIDLEELKSSLEEQAGKRKELLVTLLDAEVIHK